VNYLSLRTKDLNTEDENCMTIFMLQVFSGNIEMASRLLVRGSNINYVNQNGKTALHMCVDNKNINAVNFLIKNRAHLHIMDLNGEDACEKAKKNGLNK
jgi:ankyrin repeat protein